MSSPRANENMMADSSCWSCSAELGAVGLFCGTCHVVQPGSSQNHFDLFHLPQGFAIDYAQLEKKYLELQHQLHPDRFAAKPGSEKLLSQTQALQVNEAYHTLKDPLRRASYLLRLHGVDYDIHAERTVHDQDLLMEMMQRRESLAEAGSIEALQEMLSGTTAEIDLQLNALERDITSANWTAVKTMLLRLQYLRKFCDDARQRQLALLESGA